jgi:hypothetical protein
MSNADVILITGSPTRPSRTVGLAEIVERQLRERGLSTKTLHLRELPADALLHAEFEQPALREALGQVEQARAVVFATPVYKATTQALIPITPSMSARCSSTISGATWRAGRFARWSTCTPATDPSAQRATTCARTR